MVGAVIVSHEDLARCILESLEKITGETRNIIALSSRGISPARLEAEIIKAIDSLADTNGIILFTDLYGGTCSIACSRIQRNHPDIAVISGFNLPLLIDFLFQRDKPVKEITDRLIERGRAGIRKHPCSSEDGS